MGDAKGHPPPRRCGTHMQLAVPLTLNNEALGPLSKDWWPSAGSIDLGSGSLITGTVSKKLRASINPAARPSSDMTVNQKTRLAVLTLYGVYCTKPLCLPLGQVAGPARTKHLPGLNPATMQMFGGKGPSPLTFYRCSLFVCLFPNDTN